MFHSKNTKILPRELQESVFFKHSSSWAIKNSNNSNFEKKIPREDSFVFLTISFISSLFNVTHTIPANTQTADNFASFSL